ncbi:MAG: glycosyltransferase, partial [Lachnospiraceae bacterium]|nr:glycosyltransferase [Lachnospiraceae bacterium]
MPISVCLISKNEEANIARCLSSLKKLGAEIILTDTGSDDRTV